MLVPGLEQLLAAVETALEALGPSWKTPPTQGAQPQEQGAKGDGKRPAEPLMLDKVPRDGEESDESIEQDLSGIAAETADLARDLARQASAYKDLAYTDPLSGLPNRRAFEDRAARLRDLADAKPLAVLMVDLDGFKRVNDSEGHDAGDRVLVLIARAIARSLREGDFVARFGGDEFAALLPRTSIAEAELLAERLRAEVESAGADTSVTASVGLAALEDDLRRALLRADVALYEAKNAGRNLVRRGE